VSFARGRLLVAAPTLPDPNFRRAVLLVCEHSDEGALGIVLNRPGELLAAEAVPELAEALDAGAVVWAGGPVGTDGVVVLAEWEDPAAAAGLVLGAVGLLGAGDGEDALAHTTRVRAFAGISGWGPNQLEAELAREDWIIVDGEPDDVFCADPVHLWGTVLARQGGRLALLARMPVDPSVN